MHVAIHSWSLRERFDGDTSFDIFKALDQAAERGFSSMEVLTGGAGSPPSHIKHDTVAGLGKVVAHARDRGVPVHCYSTYCDFAFVKDEEWRLANIEYIKTWLRLAGDTGVPNIRMLTGNDVKGEDRARLEELTLRGIEECIPVAEEAGVNMAIENHNSLFLAGTEIVSLIERFGSQRLTACPDPSNGYPLFSPDCTAKDREAMYANLETLAPHATNSHLKVAGAALPEWDLDRLVDIYVRAGYNGPITLEWIGQGELWPQLAGARETLDAALARHGVLDA